MEEINHHIEKHILGVLAFNLAARFTEMRPANVDSNLYAYHLNKLLKNKYITKTDRDYALSAKGLIYIDRLSFGKLRPTIQPKINTGIILKNEYDEILLTKRSQQPLLGFWGIPMGKLHFDDASIYAAAMRELREKTNIIVANLEHAGDCYLRYHIEEQLISSAFVHIFYKKVVRDAIHVSENVRWVGVDELGRANIIPSVPEIVRMASEQSERFFAEIDFDDNIVRNVIGSNNA